MSRDTYRYAFGEKISIQEARDSLFLAVFSAEGLHGRAQVRQDAAFCLDEKKRTCVIEAATAVGRTIANAFTGLLVRQFGEDAFAVETSTAGESAATPFVAPEQNQPFTDTEEGAGKSKRPGGKSCGAPGKSVPGGHFEAAVELDAATRKP